MSRSSPLQSVSRPPLLDPTSKPGEPRDQAFRTFVDGLVRLSTRMQALRTRLAAHMHLSSPQYAIAMMLAHEREALRVVDVAARLELSVTFVTTEIGRMERKGLVQRRHNPEDRRSSLISLAPKGRERLAAGAPFQRAVNDRLFASLSREEMLHLSTVLARIASDAELALAAAPRPSGRRAAPSRQGRPKT